MAIILGMVCGEAMAADPAGDLEKLKVELKPLRTQAYLEADVISARAKLNEAYRAYWDAVRVAMIRLDPEKKALVDQEIALRKELSAVRGEAHPKTAAAQ